MQIKKEFLFGLAQKVGIDIIGVVDLKLFAEMKEKLLPFENIPMAFFKGKLSDRFNVAGEWSEAKGIISFALSYGSSLNINGFDKHHLYISKASYGKDYHEHIRMLLFRLYTALNIYYPYHDFYQFRHFQVILEYQNHQLQILRHKYR